MASAGVAYVAIRGDFKPLYAQMRAQSGALNRSGSAIGRTAGVALAGGLAAGVGKSVSLAVNFEKSMRNVNSIAQLNEKQFAKLNKRVLDLAGPTAQAPQTLSEGLYDLVSSGFSANESIKILSKSARAATAGLTDTATSTKAVAAVLNAYRLGAGKAGEVSDTLFRTVDRGVISFEELAQNVGDVLPFASSLGINLNEVGAAISTMTKAGISAPETMTRIKSAMQAFLKPSKEMQQALKSQGYESGEALIKAKGFQGALEAMSKASGGSKQELAKLFPNVRALGGALALTGGNAKVARQDLKGLKDSSGATSRALSEQSKSVAYQWQRLKAQASVLGIEVGEKLLPEFNKFLRVITDPKLSGSEKLGRVFEMLAESAGAAAPKVAWAFVKAFTGANVWGKLVIGGVLLSKMGGLGAFSSLGGRAGGQMAEGAATSFKTRFKARLGGLAKGLGIASILSGALTSATEGGGLSDRLQNFVSGATFGLVETAEQGRLKAAANLIANVRKGLEGAAAAGSSAKMHDAAATLNRLANSKIGDKWFDRAALRQGANAIDHTAQRVDHLRDSIIRMRQGSVLNIRDLRKAVTSNFNTIQDVMGAKSKAGAVAVSENTSTAVRSIKRFMRDGTLTAKQGMAEIQRVFVAEMKLYGISGNQANADANRRAYDLTHGVKNRPGNAKGGLHWFGKPGQVGHDTIPATIGEQRVVVAPGEVAAVFNRHQLPEANARFADEGGLQGFFEKRKRPHYMAIGGLAGGVSAAASAVLKRFPGLSVTSTYRPGDPGYHGRHQAVDLASGDYGYMNRAAAWVGRAMPGITEGIHNPNLSIKNGQRVPSSFWGPATWAAHANHIHIAVAGALGRIKAGVGSVADVKLIKRFLVVGPDSPLKRIVQGALDTTRDAANARLKSAAGFASGGLAGLNHRFPRHSLGEPQARLSAGQVYDLARAVGFDAAGAKHMTEIAHGESNYMPGVVSSDGGYGLWQMTPRVWGARAISRMNQLGGVGQMLNPVKNALMARFLFKDSGYQPWFGTRYLTGRDGGLGGGINLGGAAGGGGGMGVSGGGSGIGGIRSGGPGPGVGFTDGPVRNVPNIGRPAIMGSIGMGSNRPQMVAAGTKGLGTSGRRFGPNDDLPTPLDYLNAALAQAGLTPGLEDDIAAARALLQYGTTAYNQAVQSGDPRAITEAATNLKGFKDSLDQLTNAVDDNTQAQLANTQAQLELVTQQRNEGNLRYGVSQRQYSVFREVDAAVERVTRRQARHGVRALPGRSGT